MLDKLELSNSDMLIFSQSEVIGVDLGETIVSLGIATGKNPLNI